MAMRIYCILILLLSESSCNARPQQPSDDRSECEQIAIHPVLFVHGSGLGPETWRPMIHHFGSLQYPDKFLFAPEMTPNDGDNILAAQTFIQSAVDKLLAEARAANISGRCDEEVAEQVDIVAHSMGASSSRWFVSKIGPEKVRNLVTIAGANHGTNSLCNREGIGDRQMCPAFALNRTESNLQIELNGSPDDPRDETPYGIGADPHNVPRISPNETRNILYTTIRLVEDPWIRPSQSAELAGAGGTDYPAADNHALQESSPGNFVFIGSSTHDELPSHPAIIEFIHRLFAQPGNIN